MNVRRFVGKNAREAMAQARSAWGDHAVVLSNRPVPGGVEILAMANTEVPDPVARPRGAGHDQSGFGHDKPLGRPATRGAAAAPRAKPAATPVAPMSTLSFQEFVRERQRQDALSARGQAQLPAPQAEEDEEALHEMLSRAAPAPAPAPQPAPQPQPMVRVPPLEPARFAAEALARELQDEPPVPPRAAAAAASVTGIATLAGSGAIGPEAAARAFAEVAQASQGDEVMNELREMRSMISAQLANLSWFDSVRRSPQQTQLLRLMLGNGFSASLARQLVHRLPAEHDEARATQWLAEVLARNLRCSEQNSIQEQGGVFALVGPTGVGKTTTTAKIAANFALKHGPGSVGLITVDTYRMAASDQLRAFGRILNIPVHTARDSASLADLLDLFTNKKLVLIDTVGVGQRDRRLAELFAALPAQRIQRLLVLNAAAQPETLDEVVQAYSSGPGTRCVFSKLDEAVKCGGVIDVAVRHQLQVEGFANGQRVPEDWHAARAQLLVHKSLIKPASTIYTPDAGELALVLTGPQPAPRRAEGVQRA